jgi:hypothetical protein
MPLPAARICGPESSERFPSRMDDEAALGEPLANITGKAVEASTIRE